MTPLKRSSPPRRHRELKRGKSLKKVNRKRRSSEWARAYGSEERVEFVKSLGCLVANDFCSTTIENAHIKSGGKGRKADAEFIVPLCSGHHRILHEEGAKTFEAVYLPYTTLSYEAALTATRWEYEHRPSHQSSSRRGGGRAE